MISGASRGIGRAVALDLARAGADLTLLARSEEALAETATLCRAEGARVLAIPTDVTERAALERAVSKTVDELGGLNVLVNNAGIYAKGPAQSADIDAFERVIDVNVKALMNLTRLALPHILAAQGHRAVIHIASIVSRMSFAQGGAYCASKHAVLGYSNSLFEDVREAGVKVCAIRPGFVATDMVAGHGLDMDKMIQPQDIAKTVRFVATYPDTGCPVEIIVRPQRSPY
jgi:NADP-dependent 3-hydroxy acid dehydrogenase YdfG